MSRTFRAGPTDPVDLFDTTTTGDITIGSAQTSGVINIGNDSGGRVTIRGSNYTAPLPFVLQAFDATTGEPTYQVTNGQRGHYVAQGNVVHYMGRLQWTAKGSVTGTDPVRITLPVPSSGLDTYSGMGYVMTTAATITDTPYAVTPVGGGSYINIRHTSPGVSDSDLIWNELDASGVLEFTITYIVD